VSGFELDLLRRSAPGAVHEEAHDIEAQPLVYGL
jgi:DNA-binding XRE family transcriptional regulator